MQCIYCDAENPENAVFCKKCGRRLDGMALCGACGKLTPSDGEFCVHCGSNRNAPVYEMPLRFPGAKNTSADAKAEKAYGNAVYAEGARNKKLARIQGDTEQYGSEGIKLRSKKSIITEKISVLCALAAAFFGMIFVFLIGAVQGASAGGGAAVGGPVKSIFYFFGEAFDATNSTGGDVSTAKMLGAVIGTLCAVGALAGTAICFIITVIRLVKILRKQTHKSLLVPAFATYTAYICGIAMFLFCVSSNTDVAGVSIGFKASGATVAGIILGAVFLAASVVLGVVSRGIRTSVGEFVLHCTSKTVYAILAFVVLGLIGGGAIFLGMDSVSSSYGIEAWFGMIAALYTNGKAGSAYSASLAVGILLSVFVLTFCVLLTLALSKSFRSVENRINRFTFLTMFLTGVGAVLAGGLMFVGSSVYANNAGGMVAYSVSAGTPVAVIILGVLIVAGMIVYGMLSKKFASRGAGEAGNLSDGEPIAEDSADGAEK